MADRDGSEEAAATAATAAATAPVVATAAAEPVGRTEPAPSPPGRIRRWWRRWWRRYWRGGAAALVALAGLALLAFGPAGLAVGARDYTQQRAQAAAAAEPQPGVEVRDGPISFVVHTIQCGSAERGDGQRCQVTVEARNDGGEELTVPGAAQRLHGSEGARHSPAADQPGEPFGTLRAGQAATAMIRFELPAHSRPTYVEVHATAYTRGQAVAITGGPLPLLAADD